MRKKLVFKRLPEYLRWEVINSNFSYYLLVSLFVSSDSISLILKQNNTITCDLTTWTRGAFRIKFNIGEFKCLMTESFARNSLRIKAKNIDVQNTSVHKYIFL